MALAPCAHAEEDKRLAMARDALHRAQTSLQSTQAERDALAQQKAKLEQEKQAADQQLAQVSARQRESGALRAKSEAALAAANTERDQLKTALEAAQADRAALQKQLEDTQGRLSQSQAQAVDQRRTTASLAAILQRSVAALETSEKQNRALADHGRVALDSWRTCERDGSGKVQATLHEAGFSEVWSETRAETLRREMEAVTAPPRSTASR
jgi:septal ring factor EnvC (AmiA/AmiB activator)